MTIRISNLSLLLLISLLVVLILGPKSRQQPQEKPNAHSIPTPPKTPETGTERRRPPIDADFVKMAMDAAAIKRGQKVYESFDVVGEPT